MDYKILILGIISLLFGLYFFPKTLKDLNEFDISYRTVKGFILSIGGILAGLYMIANELAEII